MTRSSAPETSASVPDPDSGLITYIYGWHGPGSFGGFPKKKQKLKG